MMSPLPASSATVPGVEAAFRAARAEAEARDRADPLGHVRERFLLNEGTINLDGNSLGSMPRAVAERMERVLKQEWADGLIRSWGGAEWFRLPEIAGDRIAPLIGAGQGEVVVGDSTSVNLFKCMAAALAMRPERRVLVAQADNFPTDNYIAQGLAELVPGVTLRAVDTGQALIEAIDSSVAAVVLSHVHYRSAAIEDMPAINRAAGASGALTVWDLSHSTGAVPVDLGGSGADFAVGCTYKYLNGGPGAPAFCWVSPRHLPNARQPLSGWMGHQSPFAFDYGYRPAEGVRRFVCGTPQILSLSALDESLKLWSEIDLSALFGKSRELTSFFISLVEQTCTEFGLAVDSPRDPEKRGSHVILRCKHGLPVIRALAAEGVIGDFRAPDGIRFGFAPLYVRFVDVVRAVEGLHRTLATRSWDSEEFNRATVVT